MPLILPIEGATDAPSSEVVWPAFSSISLASSETSRGFSSIDTTAESLWAGFSSADTVREQTDRYESSIGVGAGSLYDAAGSLNIIAGESFLILADVLAENISGPRLGSYGFYYINAALTVNGDPIGIKSFDYSAPTGKLGRLLSVVLAEPDTTLVPNGAEIDFSLILKVGGVETTYSLMSSGKLQGKDYTVSFGPKDQVTFSSLDVLADKFSLSPRRSITMFDPTRIRYDQVNVKNDQMTRDSNGRVIPPILEPVVGLTMKQILERAYTGRGGRAFISSFGTLVFNWSGSVSGDGTEQVGLGFDAVITNIKNYPVRRADFTLERGWHDGAEPTVTMYEPQYWVNDDKLFIMDTDKKMPHGVSAHTIPLAVHKSFVERLEFTPDKNAVLLTYQYDSNDPSEDPQKTFRDVFTTEEPDESGVRGTAGYSKVTKTRWDREYYMPDAPDDVLDTFPISSTTETVQAVQWYDDEGLPTGIVRERITGQETIEYTYEGDLETGHKRTTKAAVANPGSGFLVELMTVEEETCDISWTDDPNVPGAKLQSSVRIDTLGLCAVDPDNQETVSDEAGDIVFTRPIPVLLAQQSGLLGDGWVFTGLIPTKTTRKTLRNMKGRQYNVEVIATDCLNNTSDTSYTDPVTGSARHDPYESRSRTRLFRDLTSEDLIGPRIPVGKNAYELPRTRAFELGAKELYRLSHPPFLIPIEINGVDLVIDKGSVINVQRRDGTYTNDYIVTGFNINGVNLGKQGHRISQTVDTIEIFNN